MEIVGFKAEHAQYLGDKNGLYASFAVKGVAYTLMNGDPVFCAGAACIWPHVAEAWFLAGDAVKKHPISVYKITTCLIADAIGRLKLHRLQATVDVADETAIRFIEGLAFRREGLMQRFSADGRDYYLYARIV